MRGIAYFVGVGVLFVVYALSAAAIVQADSYPDDGPLSHERPALTAPLTDAISLGAVLDTCFPERTSEAVTKVVGAELGGKPYYACYALDDNHGGSIGADVLDGRGRRVGDADLIKQSGAWPWVGWVSSSRDFVLNGAVALGIVTSFFLWHLLQGPFAVGARRGLLRTTGLVLVGIVLAVLGLVVFAVGVSGLMHPDPSGIAALSLLLSSFVYGPLAGRSVVAGRELLPDLDLGPRFRDLAPALAGCLVIAPALVVLLVFLSALGEVPVTSTLLTGLAVVGAAFSAVAAACVMWQWSSAQRVSKPLRPLLLRGAAWGAAAGIGAVLLGVALGVITDDVPAWVPTLEGDVATSRTEAVIPPPAVTEPTPAGEDAPSAEELQASRAIGRASGRRVRRAYCSSGVCDVVFANGTCEVWLVVAQEPNRVPVLTCEQSDVASP